jgi:hypothetical protein
MQDFTACKRSLEVFAILNMQNSHSFIRSSFSLPDVSDGRTSRELW